MWHVIRGGGSEKKKKKKKNTHEKQHELAIHNQISLHFDLLAFQEKVQHYPDPWADLESRTPLRVPRNYPIVV